MTLHFPHRPHLRRPTDRHIGEAVAFLAAMGLFLIAVIVHVGSGS